MENNNARSLCDSDQSHNDLHHPDGRPYIPYEWVSGGHCVVCKLPFSGPHLASAVTCGDTCRKRLQRIRAREKKAMSRAMSELQIMRAGIKRRERTPEFIAELNRLKGEINDLLLLAGDSEQLAKRDMMEGLQKYTIPYP